MPGVGAVGRRYFERANIINDLGFVDTYGVLD